MSRALIREIPDTFDRAIVRDPTRSPDVGLARRQHRGYREHLERAGYQVAVVPADDAHPDCVFIEDTAVVIGGVAVVARPGAGSRRDEVGPVAALLEETHELRTIEAPGTLDGGDIMVMGGHIYAGRSERTNDSGISQLREATIDQVGEMTVVPVAGVLHLKSGVLPVGPETVVVTPGTVDESLLAGLRIIYEEESERHQFTALPLRDHKVLVSASAPRTGETVAAAGIDVVPIDISEILAADGGLTCMSILY